MTNEFLEFVTEQFSVLGNVQIKRMFGGAGIYLDGTMFGLISDELIYLKVDDSNRKEFEDAGMTPFTYNGKNKPVSLSYYQVPEDVWEDQDELAKWANKAVLVSLAARK